jgi:tetratricopeptide (TPR) repeat protein
MSDVRHVGEGGRQEEHGDEGQHCEAEDQPDTAEPPGDEDPGGGERHLREEELFYVGEAAGEAEEASEGSAPTSPRAAAAEVGLDAAAEASGPGEARCGRAMPSCALLPRLRLCDLDEPVSRHSLGAGSAAAAAKHKDEGDAHFLDGDYHEARADYSMAMSLAPRDASLWLNRSIANRHCGFWHDAERDAAVALVLQPTYVKAHYSRVVALQRIGDLDAALAACADGLAIQPDNKALLLLRRDLLRVVHS